MPETIFRDSTPVGYRTQMVNLVVDRMQHSLTHYTVIRKEIPQLYDLYRGLLTGRFSPHKNNLHIPLIFSTVQSDVARKTATSFNQWPIVRFLGYGPNDAPIARKRESLISAQMKDCKSFQKAYDLFLTSDLYGTAVSRYGWNHIEQEMMLTFRERLPISGASVQRTEIRDIVVFDGPNWKIDDLLDCFPQPGFKNPEDMDWFIVREYMDLDYVRRLARFSEDGLTVFDPIEVRRMEQEGVGVPPAPDDYKTWRTMTRSIFDQDARNREKYARPVEILHMIGTIPSELVPEEEDRPEGEMQTIHRILTVANRRYMLRNRPNPFWNGKKNVLAYSPMPDPHFFYAPGKAEIAKKLQIIANRFTNQQLDALDIFIDPAFFYNTNSNLQTRNLLMRPGKFIPLDGEPGANIQPVVPNLSGVQLGGQMTEMVWRWMQQGSGIVEDTVMGGGGGRQTAREFVGRSEAVATRLMLESRLFEENFLEPLADAFVDLNRQFLELPREIFILGESAQIDPVTGKQVPSSGRESVDGWDLVPNYDARAVGATTQLNRSQRRQDTAFLIQAMSANPITASAVNWINFFKDVLRLFDYDNVNEIINSQPEMQKVLALAGKGPETQAQEVPGTPTGPNGMMDLANYLGQGQT
jgi:hypothetical protein